MHEPLELRRLARIAHAAQALCGIHEQRSLQRFTDALSRSQSSATSKAPCGLIQRGERLALSLFDDITAY
jgi:hypothetical protein